MRIKTTLLAACAAALIAPAASQAATLGMDGDTLVYKGEGSEGISLLLSSYEDWNTGTEYLRFSESGAAVTITAAICDDDPVGGIICERDPNRPIKIEGSDAKDDISIYSSDAVPDSIPVTINGNGGDDRIKDAYDSSAGRVISGGAGNDELTGYAGNDTLDGGDGNDTMDGGEGNDQVLGGNGDDVVDGDGYKDPGSDVIDGGAGYDYFEGWGQPDQLQRQPTVTLTLDGAANDGRPGENDNVTNVEDFQMYVVGSLTGSDGPEKFVIYNPGNSGPSALIGRGGDDELVGNDFDDSVDGGAGNDHVEGGLGNDTVTGGPGRDTIYGDATASRCTYYSCKIPFGNDVVNARDGEADNVDCGIGQDKAIVDAVDVVANCETVEGAGSNGPPSGGNGAAKVTFPKGKLSAVAAKGLALKLTCSAACSATATMTAEKATARKLGAKKVGSGKGKLAKAGTATLRVKVAKKLVRKLKRLKTAKTTVKVIVKQGGKTQTISRAVTLKR
jgi:RTX calcium-binding nonapeptide repeat (4 copies)